MHQVSQPHLGNLLCSLPSEVIFRSIAHGLDGYASPILAFHTTCQAMRETITPVSKRLALSSPTKIPPGGGDLDRVASVQPS